MENWIRNVVTVAVLAVLVTIAGSAWAFLLCAGVNR